MFAQCVTFFTVGFDTTASTITCALHLLARHPECQDKLFQEIQEALKNTGGEITYDMFKSMPYLEAVICESLRMYPALPLISREVAEDFRFGDTGLQLKKGMEVNIPLIGIHYDSEYYPEPYKFKPERFLPENKDSITPFTYMPFGLGPRSCVALRFAQMEAKAAIVNLLREFRFTKSTRTTVSLIWFYII
ncbi:Cyp6a9 [Cordylochernes scorpioides]|uniref:Cyp6a9 n=1 Tax=Cordylochernes scorpioides TaxID=51811 RepID=A0ABY6LQY3_9ARAC|nr:Cyp6a9 [Cordylochernes scorpioides]